MKRAFSRLSPDKTTFLVCDIQERFKDLIVNMPMVVRSASVLVQAAKVLEVPVVATEQYPKAFGGAVKELQLPTLSADNGFSPIVDTSLAVFPKTQFSMWTDDVQSFMKSHHADRDSFVICGIETHICVQQTTLHLLEMGYNVHIVEDGVSSCHKSDRTTAIEAMRQAGAFITSTESVLFELMRDAKHPSFKAMSPIIGTTRVPFE